MITLRRFPEILMWTIRNVILYLSHAEVYTIGSHFQNCRCKVFISYQSSRIIISIRKWLFWQRILYLSRYIASHSFTVLLSQCSLIRTHSGPTRGKKIIGASRFFNHDKLTCYSIKNVAARAVLLFVRVIDLDNRDSTVRFFIIVLTDS